MQVILLSDLEMLSNNHFPLPDVFLFYCRGVRVLTPSEVRPYTSMSVSFALLVTGVKLYNQGIPHLYFRAESKCYQHVCLNCYVT